MQDTVARVLAFYRRESGDPPFAPIDHLLLDAGLIELSRRIEIDAEVRRLLGRACDPQRWLADAAAATDRLDAIDAIVTAALGDLSDDAAFSERARTIARIGSEFAAAVARLRLVRELLRSVDDDIEAGRTNDPVLPTPPCDFGPSSGAEAHRFELLRRLGAGANGTVYEAIDRRYSEGAYRHVVVVKILPPAIADRADLELLRGSRVQHPSVVRWLDSGIDPSGCGFVVSELVSGRTLEDAGVLESLGRRGTVDVVRQMARAIEAAHAAGVLHLDLKPANVLVAADGVARLCDFGAARTVTSADRVDESTPFFAAPEVLDGGAGSIAADIYALGAMLRWCIDEADVLGSTSLDPRDGERLEQIWTRAMDPTPARRHAAARELARDLDAWIEHRPLPSETPSLPASLRLSIRRDPVTWVLASAAIAAVALLGWFWITDRIQESNRRADRLASETRQLRARAALSEYVGRLGDLASANGLSTAPQVIAMQWLVGPMGVRDQQLEAQTRQAQRAAWAAVIRDADATGRRDRLEAKLAALCLAASDLETNSAVRADALMREDLPWWRHRLPEDDPTLLAAEAISLLAAFRVEPAGAGRDAAAWRERLQRNRAAIGERDAKIARLFDQALEQLKQGAPR